MKNLAIFVSGNGTNCENIIQYFKDSKEVNIALVISNKEDAYALTRARNHQVATCVINKEMFKDEQAVMKVMNDYHIDFIVLAGFLLQIPDYLIKAYDTK